jgi:photosystem II stability/assembly factor-like uncharacterized protein
MRPDSRRRHLASIALALVAVGAASVLYMRAPGPGGAAPSPRQHLTLESAQFQSSEIGWLLLRSAVSGTDELVSTSDAARSWRRIALPPDASGDVLGVQLIDRSAGTLQLGHGLRITQDGGTTWHEVVLPDGARPGTGVYSIDPLHAWYLTVSHADGIQRPASMWSTGDGGATWTRLFAVTSTGAVRNGVPLEGDKRLLGFATQEIGWLQVVSVASSLLLATHDGGRTWRPVKLPVDAPAVAMHLFTGGEVLLLLAGAPGYLVVTSTDGGASWTGPRQVPVAGLNFGPPARPAFIDSDTWLLPAGHYVDVTNDGGKSWKTSVAQVPPGLQLEYLPLVAPSGKGFAVARDGVDNPYLLETSDSGAHWAQVSVPQLA